MKPARPASWETLDGHWESRHMPRKKEDVPEDRRLQWGLFEVVQIESESALVLVPQLEAMSLDCKDHLPVLKSGWISAEARARDAQTAAALGVRRTTARGASCISLLGLET